MIYACKVVASKKARFHFSQTEATEAFEFIHVSDSRHVLKRYGFIFDIDSIDVDLCHQSEM